MKTDVISVFGRGNRAEAALEQADKVVAYKGLTGKNALHLRLLTEEMTGLMRSVTGATEGQFWIEDHEVVNEYVTFKIEMPLKVGMMLTLLRDRLTDPDATMQFRDELFTGNVMFPNGLR